MSAEPFGSNPIGATKVRRIVDCTVKVKPFDIGELMEGLAKPHI